MRSSINKANTEVTISGDIYYRSIYDSKMLEKNKDMKTEDRYKITLALDENRYNSLLDLCYKYRTQHQKDLTPKEYTLMLIDSAISSVQGPKGE